VTTVKPPPLPLIFAITVTGILANTLVGPAIPDILDAFDQPDSRAGLFVAAGTLPGIVMAPVIGILADRFGRRAVLVPCLVAFGVFGLLSALAPSFPALLVLRLLQGIGSAGLINLAVVLIGDHWTGLERARLVGQNAAILTISLAVFPPLGGALTELGGWRLSFTPYALGLATAVLIYHRLDANRPAGGVTIRDQLRGARTAIRHREVIGSVSMGFVIFMLIFGLFLTAMPVHLESEFGLSAGQRGLVIAAPAITSTFTALRLGRLRGRFGGVHLLVGAGVLFTVAFVMIGAAATLPVLLAAALLYGLGEGVFIPTLQDLVAGAAAPEQRGAVVAVWVGAARAGQTAGPLTASAVYGATSTSATFMLGGAVAAALVVYELVGRFGAETHGPSPTSGARALVAAPTASD
jgi:MFS transporter, ACDE family, multidrug resistance protein